jgi:hypothetical protein
MARRVRMDRRSFLAGAIKAGIGMGLGARSLGRGSALGPTSTSSTLGDIGALGHIGSVRAEPRPPADYVSYVTRPDLTPCGVAIRTAAAFSALGPLSSFIFCAPKSPLAANPGRLAYHDPFPTGATPGLMILDTAGDLVWFKPLPGPRDIPFNFRVQTYKGKPTLTWFQGALQGAHGIGHYVLADDTYQTIAQVGATDYPCDLHEFILTPEGTALHTAYEQGVVTDDGAPLIVGHALEVDVATNELIFDWPCYPAVNPDLAYTRQLGDYFHINSIGLWPGPARNLLISSRNTCAVYLVDRRTKRVVWRLGGKQSDFAMGPGARFYFQHDARALADGSGLSVFDDASRPCPETMASGKVLAVDHQGMTANLLHRYLHTDRELHTPSQGNCQLLPNRGHVVGWGFLPFFSAYAASQGTLEAPLILDGRFPRGADSYRTFMFEWVGNPPLSELAVVVGPVDVTGHLRAWVSWNGATEVAAWRVNGGSSIASLEPLATAKKNGFETVIDVIGDGAKVFEVDALDNKGQVIGRSNPVAAA